VLDANVAIPADPSLAADVLAGDAGTPENEDPPPPDPEPAAKPDEGEGPESS
jgi:hypothetical protein